LDSRIARIARVIVLLGHLVIVTLVSVDLGVVIVVLGPILIVCVSLGETIVGVDDFIVLIILIRRPRKISILYTMGIARICSLLRIELSFRGIVGRVWECLPRLVALRVVVAGRESACFLPSKLGSFVL